MADNKQLPPFDKYFYYLESVQSPDLDAEFLDQAYRDMRDDRSPHSMREDFCGTFALCCEWVKLDPKNTALGIDLDEEPLKYGRENFFSKLSPDEQRRVEHRRENVLQKRDGESFDIINALNFSYFMFKTRKELMNYFEHAYHALAADGVLILDVFGGSEVCDPQEDELEFDGFSYFWDQVNFNPINNCAQFYIHFERKGEAKREKVFSYDWRVWSIPELRDMLEEVGFKKTQVYWEGTDDDGEGDGEYHPTEQGEANCESYVAYIVAGK